MGIFRAIERPSLHELMNEQVAASRKANPADLQQLVKGPEAWNVQ